ncbi:hypothetical protein CN311_04580 [Mesorhizobium sanjuanii]|uniref:Uncharacterized protein n=1 Tax=Mesorhizobium sanjuanii TaxID=2037900 RepID=A0A2A6FKM6_9HYPH|nr:hypothetical protein [Mesorhizobium sanjuanii]PDQ22191.1 hypothetical protein CN311_04580 [Mesorhizobium sanjuanii]
MTTAQGTDIDSSARALPPGPFEAAVEERRGPTMRDALMTGLLVIYPALATVAAIVAGLFLAGAGGV